MVVEVARYFLNALNDDAAAGGSAALASLLHPAHPTQAGCTPGPDTFSDVFSYVNDVLPEGACVGSRMVS
jgi:hypothetical protein